VIRTLRTASGGGIVHAWRFGKVGVKIAGVVAGQTASSTVRVVPMGGRVHPM